MLDDNRESFIKNYNGKSFDAIFADIKELKKANQELRSQVAVIVPSSEAAKFVADSFGRTLALTPI